MDRKKQAAENIPGDSKKNNQVNKKEEPEQELGSANAFEATENNVEETDKEWSDEDLDEWLDD